jgi:2-polyprenyl-3-methyl-5-hydroxy-6-metoxy-1,4-benzoquinol methylase
METRPKSAAPAHQVRERKVDVKDAREDCPNCGTWHQLTDFYEVDQVPVHSVLLMDNEEEAVSYLKRDLRLSFCQHCGFILNRIFDPLVHEYSSRYEETQGFSETFNAFSDRLARQLIERHDLHGKRIIEIGCGKGEFLTHICDLGENTGVGFDPAYVSTRSRAKQSERVRFVKDFYSEKYASYQADFVCCKMTLEHINETREFISTIRNSLAASPHAVVFFQVPDVTRVLEEAAFWDIYYEHCSYFDRGSLRYLFESCGFEALEIWDDYDGQYLMIEATPTRSAPGYVPVSSSTIEETRSRIDSFTSAVVRSTSAWVRYLDEMKEEDRRVVLWGGGSKAVAFLTTLNVTDQVACAVDINPNKHDTFLPGTGHKVVSPESLQHVRPDAVIVMNPVYTNEIRDSLSALGLTPDVIPVTTIPDLVERQ